MAEAKVMRCSCQHEEQDKLYGKGFRLFNPTRQSSKEMGYRCTVCGAEVKPR